MTYSSALRNYDRQEVKRLRRQLARIQTLLYQELGDRFTQAPVNTPLGEVRRLLRGGD